MIRLGWGFQGEAAGGAAGGVARVPGVDKGSVIDKGAPPGCRVAKTLDAPTV